MPTDQAPGGAPSPASAPPPSRRDLAGRAAPSNRRRSRLEVVAGAALHLLSGVFPRLRALRRYAPPAPVPEGELTVAPEAVGQVRFGTWTVEFSPDMIRLSAAPLPPGTKERPVWVRRGAFLGAGLTRTVWTEHQGSLSLVPTRMADTPVQHVASLRAEQDPDGPAAVLRGVLRGHGGRTRPWEVRLVAETGHPERCRIEIFVDVQAPPHHRPAPHPRLAHEVDGPEGPHPTVRFMADLPLDWRVDARVRLHGLGEQFTDFALNEAVFAVLSREGGIGRGLQPLSGLLELIHGAGGDPTTTYAPLPMLLRGSSAFTVDTTVPSLWDLRDDRVAVEVLDSSLTTHIIVPTASADCPLERTTWIDGGPDRPAPVPADPTVRVQPSHRNLLRNLTALTGRMHGLPDQVQKGMILAVQGGSDTVRQKVAALENAGAELAGIWVQDWVGRRDTEFGARLWWTWQVDRHVYPDFEDLAAEHAERGIATYTYVNPAFAEPGAYPRTLARDLHTEAADLGHLVLDPTGRRPYRHDEHGFHTGLVDLTSPDARDWLVDVLVSEVALPGVKGWMADFAEGIPMDARLADGSTLEWRNRWPAAWAEVNRRAIERSGLGDEAFVFHRSAGVGSAAHAGAFWAGDQLTSWDRHDGLASALHGMLSGGVSGMTITHSDVGGFTSIVHPLLRITRDAELLQRWAELGAWGAILRTHETVRPESAAQPWDPDSVDGIALQSRIFAELFDYRRQVVREAVEHGLPVLRHGWVEYPGTPVAETDDQFFFGPDFLVAPVLSPGAEEVDAVLPDGDWTHLWTGTIHHGPGTVTVPAPLGRPGVFHRPGTQEVLAARIRDLAGECGA